MAYGKPIEPKRNSRLCCGTEAIIYRYFLTKIGESRCIYNVNSYIKDYSSGFLYLEHIAYSVAYTEIWYIKKNRKETCVQVFEPHNDTMPMLMYHPSSRNPLRYLRFDIPPSNQSRLFSLTINQ